MIATSSVRNPGTLRCLSASRPRRGSSAAADRDQHADRSSSSRHVSCVSCAAAVSVRRTQHLRARARSLVQVRRRARPSLERLTQLERSRSCRGD